MAGLDHVDVLPSHLAVLTMVWRAGRGLGGMVTPIDGVVVCGIQGTRRMLFVPGGTVRLRGVGSSLRAVRHCLQEGALVPRSPSLFLALLIAMQVKLRR